MFEWSVEENIVHAEAEVDAPYGGGTQGALFDAKVTAKQNLSLPYKLHMWAINAVTDLNLDKAELLV